MKRKIVIIGPKFFGYSEAVVKTLKEELNVEAKFIDERGGNNFFTKALYRSVFLREIFKCLISKRRKKIYYDIANFDPTDIVFISPEYMCLKDFEYLSKLNAKVSLYMWDSFANKPAALPYLECFDKCMSFDWDDAKKYDLELLNLFAEKIFFGPQRYFCERKYDVCFVGTLHSNRIKHLADLQNISKRLGLKVLLHGFYGNFFYFFKTRLFELRNQIKIGTWSSLSKAETAELFKDTRVVVDITHPNQRGLTSRTFEALSAETRLLTNNKHAKIVLEKFSDQIFKFEDHDFENVLISALKTTQLTIRPKDLSYLSVQRFCKELLK
jgi:hypothetical protein